MTDDYTPDDDYLEDEPDTMLTEDEYRQQVLATAQALIEQEQAEREQHEEEWEEHVYGRAADLERRLKRTITDRELRSVVETLQADPEAEIDPSEYERDLSRDDNERVRYAAEIAESHIQDNQQDDPTRTDFEHDTEVAQEWGE